MDFAAMALGGVVAEPVLEEGGAGERERWLSKVSNREGVGLREGDQGSLL